ncbi:hypothetical protein ALC53_13096 [Atta colombica]|uniref:DNA-directed DNA polymerase n=1 Tax=Atta colombica TaxID=520822 RepID=A0A151HY37_9HYME|nr:hypothetical protein ALC53_13096 [Atta colombica]
MMQIFEKNRIKISLQYTANDFLKTVKPLIEQFGFENVFNSDQSGFQLKIHSGRLLSNQEIKKVEPLDIYGFRIWKNFAKRFSDIVLSLESNINLHERNNIIKLQFLIHNQLSFPRYHNLFKYSWFKSSYTNERPEEFENPEFNFNKNSTTCNIESCNIAVVRSSHTSTMVQNYLETLNWEVLPRFIIYADLKCVLQKMEPERNIPVIFHNLFGYDAHFVIKEIATTYEGQEDVLSITKEKYLSFTKHIINTAETTYDVLLLADIFEKIFAKVVSIDICLYLSRGCLNQCSGRYAQANNKYIRFVEIRLHSRMRAKNHFEKNLYSCSVFAENLIVVELRKFELKFNKSIYIEYMLMPLANKKVPGLMKDENNSMIIIEFVGLRVKQTITFDDYMRCLKREIRELK